MKIVFINRFFDPDQSATSRMTSSLAFALASGGWAVHIVTSNHLHNDPRASLPARATTNGVIVHRVPGSRFGRVKLFGRLLDYLSFCCAASWQVWRLSTYGDIVVAGTDPPLFPICAALVTRVRGARLVNWLQDLFPEVAAALGVRGLGGLANRGLCALRDLSLHVAEANVVPGSGMAAYLKWRGIPATQIWVRHNWSDGSLVRPIAPEANLLRREWRLNDRFVVGYSGNMGRAHEFATIMAAARALRDRSDVVFLLVGEGYHRPWVEAQVEANALTNVLLKPLQPEARLCESLSLPDVHLVSLRPELEGFVVPSKFYGAAAAGRAVLFIGAANGDLGRLVSSENCGAVIPLGDHDALCEWILLLRDRPELCAAWGRNARVLFDAQFEQRHAFASWRQLLVLGGLQPAPAAGGLQPPWAAADPVVAENRPPAGLIRTHGLAPASLRPANVVPGPGLRSPGP
jgi:colanic acid biosynthesis glycosyl transferase WcaI